MKRILIVLLSSLLVSVGAWAEVVSETQARKIAQEFRQRGARSVSNPTLVYTGMAKATGARSINAPTFYVYNYEGSQGFVIVSGDDCTPSVLAYADEGCFATGEGMPGQVSYWLDTYSNYIDGVRSGARAVVEAPDLGDFDIAVQPLLKTTWDQSEPYNNLCPTLSDTERCATGCAATAIAQVMNYHQWPDTGEGSVTHNDIVMDFTQSHYDWDHMRDTYTSGAYTETEGNAVAKLMLDAGMAAKMSYGYESGAQNVHIYHALYTYFKYSKKANYVSLNSMSATEWTALMRAELEAGRPVYYSGISEDQTMGHAFVCDGISENNYFFHFNWGWSGNCNGFYSVFMLNPPIPGIGGGQGQFNLDHWAIVGIEPAKEDESQLTKMPVLVLTEYFRTTTTQTSLGRSFTVSIRGIANYGPGDAKIQLAVGLYQNGEFHSIVSNPQNLTISEFRGTVINSYSVVLPDTLSGGEYELRVLVGTDGNWQEPVYERGAYLRSIHLTVQDKKIVVQPAKCEGLDILCAINGEIPANLPEHFLPGKDYPIKAVLVNRGTMHFNGVVGYRLLKCPEEVEGPSTGVTADTVTVSEGTTQMLLYGGNNGKDFDFTIRMNEPGSYRLECYYTEPVNGDEVIISGINNIRVEEPSEKFPRRVVVEQLAGEDASEDYQALEELTTQYPDNFIAMTIEAGSAYADSLGMPAGATALMNRRHSLPLEGAAACKDGFQELMNLPVIASMEAKAKYTTGLKDEMTVTLRTKFAYTADSIDMRMALVALDRRAVSDESYTFVDKVADFYPADAWSGISDSIPANVNAGEEYTCSLTVKPTWEGELILVGLLLDGETGEIYNAVSLHQSEIAPSSGEVLPTKVTLERTSATMNTGVSVELTATVSPAIASQEIVWTSSNPEVASIGQWGVLNTLKAGTTVIRAASAADMEVFAELTLTVNQADYTKMQQVEAGYLHYLVHFDTCPDKLILGGELNGTDIALIRSLSGEDGTPAEETVLPTAFPLRALDISQCHIVAGGNAYYKEYVTGDNAVGPEMFESRTSLEEIVLPQTLTSIGDNAFAGCTGVKSLEIPASVTTIGYAPFYGCTGLESFVVAEENKAFKAVDSVLYNYEGTELVAYPASKADETYSTIETTTRILPYAFCYAQHLKQFSGNLRLSSLYYGAFYMAESLQTVHLGSRLMLVEEYAFAECTGLEAIVCDGVNPAECATNAFEGVSKEKCFLYVQDEEVCKDYAASPGWDYFTQIIDKAYSIRETLSDAAVRIRPLSGAIAVFGIGTGETVSVYHPTGVLVAQTTVSGGETIIPVSVSGLYIVRMAGFEGKVVVR